jgi:hypothetical protein
VADNTSGNSEELKLRITPELDTAALKKVQDQLDAIETTTAVGATKKGTGVGQQTNAIKEQTAALKEKITAQKLDIDQIDLRLRKTRTAANQEIASIRERAAVGKITMEQMNQQILQQQSIIDTATVQADVAYKTVATSLENLGQEYRDTAGAAQILTAAEKKLYYAQGRMTHGMDSMSGSMQTVVSQTKMANLAFMNFGRIVQDAPFGLIGIANNIDPLLMSFSMLSNEIDKNTQKTRGAMGAFKAMGAQLFGPSGLIFLLGSALPSALLVLQSRQQKTTEESNALADAFKKVADEFGRLSSQAASEKGIEILRNELSITKTALDEAVKGLEETNKQIALQESILSKLSFINAYSKQIKDIREQNDELKNNAEQQKEVVRILEENLKAKETELTTSELIQEVRSQYNLSESLSLKEQIQLQKELNGLRANVFEILGQDFEAEVLKETQRIKDAIADVYKIEGISIKEQIQLVFRLEDELARVEDRVRERQKNTNKAAKDDTRNTLEELAQFQLSYTRYIQNELQNRLLDAKLNYEEIAKSEFATDQQRLVARRKYLEIEESIFDDFRQRAKSKDEKDRQEKLRKDLEARRRFVNGQEIILKEFDNKQQAKNDFMLLAATLQEDEYTRIKREGYQQRLELQKIAQENGLLSTREYLTADAALHAATEREKRQYAIDTLHEVFNATIAISNLAFGETKDLRAAQVAIDTLFGVQRILAEGKMSAMAIAKAVTLAANGAITIRKIYAKQKGDASVDAGPATTTTTNEVFIERSQNRSRFMSPFANQLAPMAQPLNPFANQNINIEANVDRRGLAIAVREGERSIRTQQFDYR